MLNELKLQDGFLAFGSVSPNNRKAELFNFGNGGWKQVDDYPFGSGESDSVYDYDMVYISETQSYLVIGGYSASYLSQIAKFKDGVWSDAGQLNSGRRVSFLII